MALFARPTRSIFLYENVMRAYPNMFLYLFTEWGKTQPLLISLNFFLLTSRGPSKT